MSASYVRRYYRVDYKRNDRVTVDGRPGTIVSFPDQYLSVRFDGERRASRCHPTWRVERLDTPTLPPSSRQRGTVTAKAVHDRRPSSADEADLRDDGGTT